MLTNKKMIREFFELLFISIENSIYNLIQKVKEFFLFFPDMRFFILDMFLYFIYLFSSPFRLRKSEGHDLPVDFEELTYGETYYFTARDILKKVNFTSDDLFIDVGSGRGKMVFFVSMYFHAKATGIDILPTFINRSNYLADRLKLKDTHFILSDGRNFDFSSGTVIYLAGTCFSDSSVSLLLKSLRSAPEGAKIITLSYPLKADYLKVISKEIKYFSWGKNTVFIHEKIN
ncbi:MAG: class I SAM-dependent methyltransferase [Candidatus Eremiobacterota bacterium]